MDTTEQAWLADVRSGDVRGFFAEIGVILPDRQATELSVRCFANPAGHRRDDRDPSCSVNMITGLWDCKGCGEHGNAYQAAQSYGLHARAAARLAQRFGLFLELEKSEKPKLPGELQVRKWRHAMRENRRVLLRLLELKGWTPYAVVRLGLGWDGERIVFPVRNEKRKIVGIARYLPGGERKMLALAGSKRDLFPAPETIPRRFPLFVVEGEGDAVAVRSAGFPAVGVPGVGTWRREWALRLLGRRRVIVLSDCDPQGRDLAARIAQDVGNARVVDIEPGREDGYDIGDVVAEASAEGGLWQATHILKGLVA